MNPTSRSRSASGSPIPDARVRIPPSNGISVVTRSRHIAASPSIWEVAPYPESRAAPIRLITVNGPSVAVLRPMIVTRTRPVFDLRLWWTDSGFWEDKPLQSTSKKAAAHRCSSNPEPNRDATGGSSIANTWAHWNDLCAAGLTAPRIVQKSVRSSKYASERSVAGRIKRISLLVVHS